MVTLISHNVTTQRAEPRRVKTAQISQHSKAISVLLVTWSLVVKGVKSFSGLKACSLVAASRVKLINSVAPEPEGSSPCSQGPVPVPMLSQVNPLHTLPTNFPKIHFDPIFPSTSRSSEWLLSFGLLHEKIGEI
jgi:hypothetical protein